jgi:hypothetical protein
MVQKWSRSDEKLTRWFARFPSGWLRRFYRRGFTFMQYTNAFYDADAPNRSMTSSSMLTVLDRKPIAK